MISTLTYALGALGGVVILGVIGHGAWSARRAGLKRAALPPERPDVPTGAPPSLDPLAATDGADGAAIAELARQGVEHRPGRRLVPRLDGLIDSIATLRLEAPIPGVQAATHLPATRRAGAKPFLIEGLNEATGEWETPAAGQRYRELQAGVQLANRSGPLNEIEYSEFVQKVQAYADAVGALADFPDMLEAVAAGRELDHFADAHDAQLAVHLQARDIAWSVGYIQQHAARHGFLPGVVPGRLGMAATEEGAPPVLTLTFDSQAAFADDPNLAALRDLTLSFDVPQTAASADPFSQWQASAQALATELEANVVDDLGRVLAPESFAAIGKELVRLYATLEERDLPAGSAAARRLFS